MEFEWHETKAAMNVMKHGIAFEEAVTCFYDMHQVVFYDPEHSKDEEREIMIAHSDKGRLLLVCYTLRNNAIRLIFPYLATCREHLARGVSQGERAPAPLESPSARVSRAGDQ
ncbi:MAG: BrnT family toxin [Pseudomonadota bacterium]